MSMRVALTILAVCVGLVACTANPTPIRGAQDSGIPDGQCAYLEASQDAPDLADQVRAQLQAGGITATSVDGQYLGEDGSCMRNGTLVTTFGIQERRATVVLQVPTLSDEDALGNEAADVSRMLQLAQTTPGTLQLSVVRLVFKDATDSRNVLLRTRQVRAAEAAGAQGADYLQAIQAP